MDDSVTANPYPGPRPFAPTREEARYFFGRERETADVEDLLYSYRSVLLYSQSGAGKSSLVSAGLLSKMDPSRWMLARVIGDDPATAGANGFALNVLRSASQPLTGDAPLTLAARLARNAPEPWFLVLDQFEEIFTAHPELWQDREPFFRDLGALLRADPSCRILFVMREEFVAEVDRYGGSLPDGFEIRYRLTGLRREAALRAIIQPAEKTGDLDRAARIREISDQLVENLLTVPVQTRTEVARIKGEYVEPMYLQVICRDLWSRLGSGAAGKAADLVDVDRVLGTYYEAALRKSARSNPLREHRMRTWFETALITPAGTRGIVYMDEGKGKAAGMSAEAVRVFAEERLVRMERRAGAPWYELTHDRLIRPIRLSNSAFRARWARRFLTSAVAAAVLALVYSGTLFLSSATPQSVPRDPALQAKFETVDGQKKALEYANEIAVRALAGGTPRQAARAYATFGLTSLKTGDLETSARYLENARQANAWEALKTMNQYIEAAENARDGSRTQLDDARRLFMQDLAEHFSPAEPELKKYACDHGVAVVGANVLSDRSADEVKRLKPAFPNARVLWSEGGRDRIVLDTFLTCEVAQELRTAAQSQLPPGTNPYLRQWYPGCGGSPAGSAKTVPPASAKLPAGTVASAALTATDSLHLRVLALTASLETGEPYPASFGAVGGDFRGEGLSLGIMGWNLGQGTLQPLVSKMLERHPVDAKRYLSEDVLKGLVSAPGKKQLEWARSLEDPYGRVREPLRTNLQALAMSPEFRAIQVEAAAALYGKALMMAKEYGLWSERAVALMFDVLMQNGGISSAVQTRIRADFAGIRETTREEDETAKLVAIGQRRAEIARPEFRKDLAQRKGMIARGGGLVHGVVYDLEKQFAIRMVAFHE